MHSDLVPDSFINPDQQSGYIRRRICMQDLNYSAWVVDFASSFELILWAADKDHPIFLVFMVHDRHGDFER